MAGWWSGGGGGDGGIVGLLLERVVSVFFFGMLDWRPMGAYIWSGTGLKRRTTSIG